MLKIALSDDRYGYFDTLSKGSVLNFLIEGKIIPKLKLSSPEDEVSKKKKTIRKEINQDIISEILLMDIRKIPQAVYKCKCDIGICLKGHFEAFEKLSLNRTDLRKALEFEYITEYQTICFVLIEKLCLTSSFYFDIRSKETIKMIQQFTTLLAQTIMNGMGEFVLSPFYKKLYDPKRQVIEFDFSNSGAQWSH